MKRNSIGTSVTGTLDDTISLATRALQRMGFGVLTRIDLHQKFHDALSKEIAPTVILGACAPKLAYKAFELNQDAALFLPCNVVIQELKGNRCSVEIARPSVQLAPLSDPLLAPLAQEADLKLQEVLSLMNRSCSQSPAPGSKVSHLEEDVEEDCWDRDSRWEGTTGQEPASLS